ncbi:LCCL domain [Phaffia rhodozyma]|uniref:LCCL domain n=1 Tax=Phaffia rhodozyma TaxID=264483 RepID=A0A0F7SH57_PHARH|nr:LCCL domain [Phaffia rhodozyma]
MGDNELLGSRDDRIELGQINHLTERSPSRSAQSTKIVPSSTIPVVLSTSSASSTSTSSAFFDETVPIMPFSRTDSSASVISNNPVRQVPASFVRVQNWIGRAQRFIAGPSPPHPLPSIQPLLTVSISLPSSSRNRPINATRQSFHPDTWFTAHYLQPFRRRFPHGGWKHATLLAVFLASWIIGFSFLIRANSFLPSTEPEASGGVQVLSCTSTFWTSRDSCGLDGATCMPSNISEPIGFRCPAGCASQIIYNTRAVGDLQPDYVPFIIGGGQSEESELVYRGDSFICSAALHAGFIDNRKGGCGLINMRANVSSFPATLRNDLQSIEFPSIFPLGFSFSHVQTSYCQDLRWNVLVFNVLMTSFLSLFLDPPPLVFFWTLVCQGFWHVYTMSDPRDYPPAFSTGSQDFLPTLFVGYFFWRVAYRFTLPSFFSSPFERTLFYLGPFYPGMLINVVSAKIPIDTLTAGNIRPEGVIWVVILIVVIVICAGNQIRVMWRTGWLGFYLRWTVALGLTILVLSQLPELTFRLHHYIFAIMFMPALGFATRVSAGLQALLLGIFSDGVAKFGYDSILQTASELRRDAALGSTLPSFIANSTRFSLNQTGLGSLTVAWEPIPADLVNVWDGFSLLLNDVERFVGVGTNYTATALNISAPYFFRLAYQASGVSGDYTKAGTFWPNGTWVNPSPGASG